MHLNKKVCLVIHGWLSRDISFTYCADNGHLKLYIVINIDLINQSIILSYVCFINYSLIVSIISLLVNLWSDAKSYTVKSFVKSLDTVPKQKQ